MWAGNRLGKGSRGTGKPHMSFLHCSNLHELTRVGNLELDNDCAVETVSTAYICHIRGVNPAPFTLANGASDLRHYHVPTLAVKPSL